LRRVLTAAREALLAQLAAQGDRAAFGELVSRALPAVRSLLRRMGAQAATADDLAQEAFLAAFRGVHGYRAEGTFAAWVGRIAARLYLREVRRVHREAAQPLSDIEELVAPAPPLPGEGLDLDRALACLSTAERWCVTLCHGAGFTHEEVAMELQMPLGTVKSHVLRGSRKLRARLIDTAPRHKQEAV
jgi:RNA polymerase sigma factor (sigma-70 family)